MKIKVITLLLVLSMALSLSACGGGAAPDAANNVTYRNELLGISFTLPSGWYEMALTEKNFSTTSGTTGDLSQMEKDGDEEYIYLTLGRFANKKVDAGEKHIGLELYADKLEGTDSLATAVDDYIFLMTQPNEDGGQWTLKDQYSKTLGSNSYAVVVFTVPNADNELFEVMGFVHPVKEGFYLTLEADYWPENKNAVKEIESLVEKALSVSATPAA